MKVRHIWVSGFAAVLFALGLTPVQAAAQEECVGANPRGGMWVSSGELYIDRARRNTRPEDKRKLYQQAVDILSEGFEAQPDNPRNYAMAGTAHIGLQDYTSASQVWDKAEELWSCYHAEIDSLRFDTYVRSFNLGVRYGSAGDREKAIEAYRNANIIYPALPSPLIQIGSFYTQMSQEAADAGDSETESDYRGRAIEALRGAMDALDAERLTDDDQARYGQAASFNLAQLLAFDERYEEATQAYEIFLEISPDNVTAKSNAAVVLTLAAAQSYSQAGEMEEGEARSALEAEAEAFADRAANHYQELLAREDLDAEAYHDIGAGLSRSQNYEQAAIAFEKALELQPYRPNSMEQLAFSFYATSNYEKLIEVGATLVERYPLNLNNLALLANGYRELEMSDKALEILEKREVLKLELMDLEMETQEGAHIIHGSLHNLALEAGSTLEIAFDLRDEVGEVAGSTSVSMQTPEIDTAASFQVRVESEVPVAGFTYRVVLPGEEATGS